ncbi:hypothetical protein ORV05_00805 [Amycolatopsis cynarae]|uniref:Uncharacterized protein n=1 Tax=Amycolatopsis cynarae TaxID=2995223 RepID=A0ABY7B3Z6_9PSEU|nr:hypothetical protein [Amycolatopsis sp. HUAS 11-8]WAL66393.1 hypothetical protein ORV05_00805 [Amycolatopsis sp. HUAS 11-8]
MFGRETVVRIDDDRTDLRAHVLRHRARVVQFPVTEAAAMDVEHAGQRARAGGGVEDLDVDLALGPGCRPVLDRDVRSDGEAAHQGAEAGTGGFDVRIRVFRPFGQGVENVPQLGMDVHIQSSH